MSDPVGSAYLRERGRVAMETLLRGDRFGARRILCDLSNIRIPFARLEVAAEGMAAAAADRPQGVSLPLREIVRSRPADVGLWLLVTSFYGRAAASEPRTVLHEAEILTARGGLWWIPDLVASRMVLASMAAYPMLTLCVLGRWVRQRDPWLRRCVAVAVGHTFKKGDCPPGDLIFLLEHMRRDVSNEVQRGVSRALRTLCRRYPEVGMSTLRTWARKADPRVATVVRGGMTALGATHRQELEAVLAAR